MKPIVFGRMESGDLTRWRQACAEWEALDKNPRAFSAWETVAIIVRYYRIFGELKERCGATEGDSVRLSPVDGYCLEDKDD